MDLDNIQRKYGLPAPLPVVQNGKFATRFPLNLEHRGDDVFQFGGKYIGEIENIYDLLYKILTNQEIDASLALPYAIKITEDKLYIRDKTNNEWITVFDITKPNFPKEIELYELIYKAITHQVIGEDTSYPGQFKIEENILYVRDKDNLTWTQIGDVTKEFLGATEATQAILEQVNDILTEVQELKTELNRQIATTNETLTTALQAANEAMTSAQSINIRTFNSVEEMKASNTLKVGALVKTLGFYTAGDGGGADYVIINDIGEDETDEASIITLENGLFAKLLIKDFINVKQMGAKGDSEADDTEILQKIFELDGVKINFGTNLTYKTTEPLKIENRTGVSIIGNNSLIKLTNNNDVERDIIDINNSKNIHVYGLGVERDISAIDKGELGWDLKKGRGAGSGIVISGSTNVKIDSCNFKYFDDGVRTWRNSRLITITNNLFREIGGEPIVSNGCVDVLIENNEMYHHNGDGILVHVGAYSDDVISGDETYAVIVRGNFIHDGILPIYNNALAQDQPTLIGGGITTNSEGSNGKLQNGILVEGNTGFNIHYGAYFIACGNLRICNNYFEKLKNGGIGYVQAINGPGNNSLKLKPAVIANNIIANSKPLGTGIIKINVEKDNDTNDVNVICTGNSIYNCISTQPVYIKNTIFTDNVLTYINEEGSTKPCVTAENCIIDNLKITDYRGTYIQATSTDMSNILLKVDRFQSLASGMQPLIINGCMLNNIRISKGMGQINCNNTCTINNITIDYPNTSTNGCVFYVNGTLTINNLTINKATNGTYTNRNNIFQLVDGKVLIATNINLSVASDYIASIIYGGETCKYILDKLYTFGGVALPATGTNKIVGDRIQ